MNQKPTVTNSYECTAVASATFYLNRSADLFFTWKELQRKYHSITALMENMTKRPPVAMYDLKTATLEQMLEIQDMNIQKDDELKIKTTGPHSIKVLKYIANKVKLNIEKTGSN